MALTLSGITTSGTLTLDHDRDGDAGRRDLHVTGAAIPVFPAVTTNGTLTLGQATNFGAVTLGGTTAIDSTNTAIDFTSTVNGGFGLTVNAGTGAVTFGGVVGGTTPLASLAVTGPTTLDGFVTTTGTQTYNSAVTLGATDTLTTTNGAVDFVSTVDGAFGLTVSCRDRNGDVRRRGGRDDAAGEPGGDRSDDAGRLRHDEPGRRPTTAR